MYRFHSAPINLKTNDNFKYLQNAVSEQNDGTKSPLKQPRGMPVVNILVIPNCTEIHTYYLDLRKNNLPNCWAEDDLRCWAGMDSGEGDLSLPVWEGKEGRNRYRNLIYDRQSSQSDVEASSLSSMVNQWRLVSSVTLVTSSILPVSMSVFHNRPHGSGRKLCPETQDVARQKALSSNILYLC